MKIIKAKHNDLQNILELQYFAYQSEAELLGNFNIPPLKQSINDIEKEYEGGVILKAVDGNDVIIGSVRACEENNTVKIGKLIVHPQHQKKGLGTRLLQEIENVYPAERYELFTSDKSQNNLKLYEKAGYKRFKEQDLSPFLRLVFLEKYSITK